MKISIGPLSIVIRFPKFTTRSITPTSWPKEVWEAGMETCERVYGNLAGRIERAPTDESSTDTQSKVNLIIEETLPSPRNHKEIALQGLIRRSLVIDPSKHSPNCSLIDQYRRIALVDSIPYHPPHPSNIPLAPMLSSMYKFCKSLVKPGTKGTLVVEPFIDYLKAGQTLLYSKTLAETLYDEFLETEMPGLRSCELVYQLLYCVVGLYQLAILPEFVKGELYKAVITQKKDILKSATELKALLDELSELIVPDSGGLTHTQLIRYQRYAATLFPSIPNGKTEHHSRSKSGLSHALTLDPLEKRFFVHLKKKGLKNSEEYRDDMRVVHQALMVSHDGLSLVYDIVKTGEANISTENVLMQLFKENLHIIDPPIAISKYKKIAHFRYSYIKHLGSICDGQNIQSQLHEKICLLQDFAQGLHAIHKAGYIHGQIMPASFLLKTIGNHECQGVIGSLESAQKVDNCKKQPLTQLINEKGETQFHPDGRPRLRVQEYQGDPRYLPPECIDTSKNEPLSHKGEIWSFGIIAWQYLYGKSEGDFPLPVCTETGIPIIANTAIRKIISESMPKPRTVQENSMQLLIKCCLEVDPIKRIDNAGLVMDIECVKRRPQITYIPAKEPQPSLNDLFRPFQIFLNNGMGTRSGGQVVRTLRKTKSYLQLPGNAVGHRSLPPELFEIFCEQGNLKLHIDAFEKQIIKLAEENAHSIQSLKEAEEGLNQTLRVIEKLARIFDRFCPTHAELLESQRGNIEETCDKLNTLITTLLDFPVEDAAGLTYRQIRTYRKILKEKAKRYNKPLGFLDATQLNIPISFHFDKYSEKGLHHPVTYDPVNKSLIVHVKKRGSRKKELGKGAVKSVHEAVILQREEIQNVADAVIRLNDFDVEEERLKHIFVDCPYIEDPAEALTVYDKEEIPSMWKNKKNMEEHELKEVAKSAAKSMVRKLAFFPPLYVGSLGGFSYQKGDARDVSLLISLFANVAEGLAVMHKRGYIHRDIKPGNVLIKKIINDITSLFIGVLADLGEAAYVGDTGFLPQNINMAGTKHYNSPEVCFPKNHKRFRPQSFASDVWALGVTMLQALYGTSGRDIPFIDTNSKIHIFGQMQQLTQDDIHNALYTIFPEGCDNRQQAANMLIEECLSIDPDKRPTAQNVAKRLAK